VKSLIPAVNIHSKSYKQHEQGERKYAENEKKQNGFFNKRKGQKHDSVFTLSFR